MLGVALTFCFADDGNSYNGVYGRYIYYKDFNSLAYYGPEDEYLVPTIYLGDIANGETVTKRIHLWCYGCIPGGDPLAAVVTGSMQYKRDCFLNRDTSVGISEYPDEFYYDLRTNYPARPESCSNTSVFVEAITIPTAPPEGWINPFWNWISIPNQPLDDSVASIFSGYDVTNKLFRWNPTLKTIELYPDDFTAMEVGRGYVLAADEAMTPVYLGLPNTENFNITIPAGGWIWIGHPFEDDQLLANLSVFNMMGGQRRTAQEDHEAPDPWINWNWLYWDSYVDSCRLLHFIGADDDTLHAWYGYRLWANKGGVVLTIPVPE